MGVNQQSIELAPQTATKPLTLIRAEVSNFMRIRYAVIDLSTGQPLLTIGGDNGAGKSSLLAAIPAALGGGNMTPGMPVRKGAKKTTVNLDLGELKVQYTETAHGTRSVRAWKNGVEIKEPTKILKEIHNKASFDPLSFCNLPGKDRVAMLLKVVELETPYEELQATIAVKEAALKLARAEHDRTRKAVPLVKPEYVPASEPDEGAMTQEVIALKDRLRQLDVIKENIAPREREMEHNDKRIAELKQDIAQLEKSNEILRQQNKEAATKLASVDRPALEAKLSEAESAMSNVKSQRAAWTQMQTYKEKQQEASAAEAAFNKAKRAKEAAEERLSEVLAKATLPYPGLTWQDDEVLLDGIPFEQASQAQKLIVSTTMAFALNPALKLALIRDGALTDANSRRIIAETAAKYGGTVIMEVVGPDADLVVEDGSIVGQEPEAGE